MRTSVMTLTLAAGVLLAGFPTPGVAQQDDADAFLGVWSGLLDLGAAKLTLVFHVTRGDDGALTGALDSPDQGAKGIPASEVSVEDGTLHFAVSRIGMTYTATLSDEGASLDGQFKQGTVAVPLKLAKTTDEEAAAAGPERPQNPKPPFPYRSEEVEVASAPGVTLAGTLTIPEGEGPFPAAVLVTGSGPQDRDEALLGHKPFLVLSDYLTRHGIAVLRYDDRGVAKSTGTFAAATSEDFATDAIAAVRFLHQRPDMGAVGIIGHSEGGLVGPMAAARSDQVDYVVMLAGPGLTGAEIILLQGELIARAEGSSEEQIETSKRINKRLFSIVESEPDSAAAADKLRTALTEEIAAMPEADRKEMGAEATPEGIAATIRQLNSPWMHYFLSYDPRPTLEKVKVPVLALNGGKDLQVPPEQDIREVKAALERGGNKDVTTKILPGLNHLFQSTSTGAPSEYAKNTETMSPVALDAVAKWILERFGTRH